MNVNDAVATVGWLLLVAGWTQRRDRTRHLALVLPGMAVDLGLVLYLEFSRSVIERTMSQSYGPLETIHIASSAAAVALYLPTIALGAMLVARRGGPAVRAWHRRCAVPALVLRTVGFGFMWAV